MMWLVQEQKVLPAHLIAIWSSAIGHHSYRLGKTCFDRQTWLL
jgi:hypothetical protein